MTPAGTDGPDVVALGAADGGLDAVGLALGTGAGLLAVGVGAAGAVELQLGLGVADGVAEGAGDGVLSSAAGPLRRGSVT